MCPRKAALGTKRDEDGCDGAPETRTGAVVSFGSILQARV